MLWDLQCICNIVFTEYELRRNVDNNHLNLLCDISKKYIKHCYNLYSRIYLFLRNNNILPPSKRSNTKQISFSKYVTDTYKMINALYQNDLSVEASNYLNIFF